MKAITLFLATCLLSAPAMASLELANKNKCTICHKVDKKLLGPTFKDIAAKYRTQAGAEKMLADGVMKGSKNKWGKIPMPAQKVSAADAQTLAKWILTQK